MKKQNYITLTMLISLGLFGPEINANPNGKNLFSSKGCIACHQENVDAVGPSLKQIAQTYKGQTGQLINFLKGQGQPKLATGKFAGQYDSVMKLQLNQIKNLSAKEIKDLAEFILSH
jgi:cytochrome c